MSLSFGAALTVHGDQRLATRALLSVLSALYTSHSTHKSVSWAALLRSPGQLSMAAVYRSAPSPSLCPSSPESASEAEERVREWSRGF